MNARRFLLVLGVTILIATTASAQVQTPPAKDAAYTLPDIATKPWTGDFEGMIQRRMIRVLVPYSRTLFFIDRGTQMGFAYDAFRLLEDDLNKKLKSKHIRAHVVLEAAARDKLMPDLLAGGGDPRRGLSITLDRATYTGPGK